ncbi:L-rhamnose mutarotase [Desertivirga arenae]|uniref:L-rhamnose mutarotase n=1 Tax=Desertivirga arenae TaxID=2810309 RepID=UPI001A979CB1|nr:L-rhamnose mutarotase [Pedobacter sp. SYSU D00823]
MKRYCLALDLVDDPELIQEYVSWHRDVWPEIQLGIHESGIREMEIYLVGNRLFMIIEAEDYFTFEKKTVIDATNHKVQEWEQLMWKFQKPLPWAKNGEKWILMDRIFTLGTIKTQEKPGDRNNRK